MQANAELANRNQIAMPLPAPLLRNLSLPAIGAPMFLISGPDMVIAQAKAGMIGRYPKHWVLIPALRPGRPIWWSILQTTGCPPIWSVYCATGRRW
jgi:hypothetical protein